MPTDLAGEINMFNVTTLYYYGGNGSIVYSAQSIREMSAGHEERHSCKVPKALSTESRRYRLYHLIGGQDIVVHEQEPLSHSLGAQIRKVN